MMGWGRDRKTITKVHRVETHPKCTHVDCARPATYWCGNVVGSGYTCDACKSSCCRSVQFKVAPMYRSPIMELGSYVHANKHSIRDAPEDLLLRAYAHVEERMIRCAHGNARARATERWLGRWARIIDKELASRPYCKMCEDSGRDTEQPIFPCRYCEPGGIHMPETHSQFLARLADPRL